MEANDASIDGAERNDTSAASPTMSSPPASANISGEMRVRSPKWFAKNVRHVCDRVVGGRADNVRPCVPKWQSALQQFAVDPRSAPQAIVRGHKPNQISTR